MKDCEWKVDVLLPGTWKGATSVLVTDGRRHIMVDTGMPHESHQLVAALAERGIRPADVESVINTHFHVDHVLNNSLFPNSVIYASQECYDWCCSLYSSLLDEARWEKLVLKFYPETLDYQRAGELMGKLRKIGLRWWDPKRLGAPAQFRWIETGALPDGLESVSTRGHVPGHLSIVVPTAEERTIIAGDVVLTREVDTEVLTMIPRERRQFELDRETLLSIGGRILPGHGSEFLSKDLARPCTLGSERRSSGPVPRRRAQSRQ